MLGVLVSRISRKDVRWGVVAAFGVTGFVLALLSTLNNFPLTLYEYDTKSPLSSHLTQQLVLGFFGALATGAGIACIVAAAEPPYREQFPRHLSASCSVTRSSRSSAPTRPCSTSSRPGSARGRPPRSITATC
jgi:hypothetical protein